MSIRVKAFSVHVARSNSASKANALRLRLQSWQVIEDTALVKFGRRGIRCVAFSILLHVGILNDAGLPWSARQTHSERKASAIASLQLATNMQMYCQVTPKTWPALPFTGRRFLSPAGARSDKLRPGSQQISKRVNRNLYPVAVSLVE